MKLPCKEIEIKPNIKMHFFTSKMHILKCELKTAKLKENKDK